MNKNIQYDYISENKDKSGTSLTEADDLQEGSIVYIKDFMTANGRFYICVANIVKEVVKIGFWYSH